MNRIIQITDQGCKNRKVLEVFSRDKFKNKGFTLIELMIVIMMFGILSAVVVPSLGQWKSNMTIKKNSRDFLFAMKQARMTAIKTNSPVDFYIDTVTGKYRMEDFNTGNVYLENTLGNDLKVASSSLSNPIQFSAKGLPGTSGSIRFETTNGDEYKTIVLYLSGISKIQ